MLRLRLDNEAVRSREQARPVETGNLDHRVAAGKIVIDRHLGLNREGVVTFVARLSRRRHFGQSDLAAQGLLNVGGDALASPQLVLVALESARNENRVERKAVGRGEDLGVDDVAARRRAGAGDAGEKPRMVRARPR